MVERQTIRVPDPIGGWQTPWPNVAEIASAYSHENWTLVGGLMVQLHSIHRGISTTRPTNDIDVVLHVETDRGRPKEIEAILNSLGYDFVASIDQNNETGHRGLLS